MFLDSQLLFSDAQALTASGASTNLIDLKQTNYLFDGEPMAVVVQIDTGADYTTGDETYTFAIQCDDNSSFSSATTVVSQAISAASSNLAAGAMKVIAIPVGVAVEQYMRVYYTLAGTTPSVTLTTFLVPLSFVPKYFNYNDNITIS